MPKIDVFLELMSNLRELQKRIDAMSSESEILPDHLASVDSSASSKMVEASAFESEYWRRQLKRIASDFISADQFNSIAEELLLEGLQPAYPNVDFSELNESRKLSKKALKADMSQASRQELIALQLALKNEIQKKQSSIAELTILEGQVEAERSQFAEIQTRVFADGKALDDESLATQTNLRDQSSAALALKEMYQSVCRTKATKRIPMSECHYHE